MAQDLGLHRDRDQSKHLSPYEIEVRRRVWWALYMLDARSAEDHGSDVTIGLGSFDTKLPLNVNDADLDPEMKEIPSEREGWTDMSFALVSFELCDVSRQLLAPSDQGEAHDLEQQQRKEDRLNHIYNELDKRYFRTAKDTDQLLYWVWLNVARLMRAKMTLLIYSPALLTSSPSSALPDAVRNRLFLAAIEVFEQNDALNEERAARPWRWTYQTYTHWHAIIFLLLEVSRRPWGPTSERAWAALHSRWLFPARSSADARRQTWVPLRRLMAQARRHREAELRRLRGNDQTVAHLLKEDCNMPPSRSPGSSTVETDTAALFRERWLELVRSADRAEENSSASFTEGAASGANRIRFQSSIALDSMGASQQALVPEDRYQASSSLPSTLSSPFESKLNAPNLHEVAANQAFEQSQAPFNSVSTSLSDGQSGAPNLDSWLWTDLGSTIDPSGEVDIGALDVTMSVNDNFDWHQWIEAAKGMESCPI